MTPLHLAAHHENVAVAIALLQSEADPACVAKNGYTPLHVAAKKNQIDLAAALLRAECDINAQTRAGFTPIHLASQVKGSFCHSERISHVAVKTLT